MSSRALLSLAALLFPAAVGCAAQPEELGSPSAASSDLTAADLTRRVGAVAQRIESAGQGKVYVVVDDYVDADLPHGVPNALAGGARRQALLDCAVYGGGAAPQDADDPEQLDKYLSGAQRAGLAAELEAAIGDAPLYRINSFGIGDPGDDFSARCTVGVRLGPDRLLMLQGHGKDRL